MDRWCRGWHDRCGGFDCVGSARRERFDVDSDDIARTDVDRQRLYNDDYSVRADHGEYEYWHFHNDDRIGSVIVDNVVYVGRHYVIDDDISSVDDGQRRVKHNHVGFDWHIVDLERAVHIEHLIDDNRLRSYSLVVASDAACSERRDVNARTDDDRQWHCKFDSVVRADYHHLDRAKHWLNDHNADFDDHVWRDAAGIGFNG